MGTISVLAGVFTSALAAQTAVFPASTPASKGGWQPFDGSGLPVALTGSVMILSGSPSGTWSISGGKLVCNDTPAADDGVVLRVRDSSNRSCDVTIDATLDGEAVATWAELYDVSGTPSRMSGKTIVMRCTDYTYDGSSLYNRFAATSTCTIQAERTDGRLPIISNCKMGIAGASAVGNLHWKNIWFYRAQTGANWNWASPAYGDTIFSASGTLNPLAFTGCRFYSDVQAAGDGNYIQEDIRGVAAGGSGNYTFTDCEFDHLWLGATLTSTGNTTVTGCTFHSLFADSINASSNGSLTVTNNDFHTRFGWGTLIHPDIIQFNAAVTGAVTIKGNVDYPGTFGKARQGGDTDASDVTEATAVALTVSSHANRIIKATATTGTYTLPTAASADGEEFIVFALASGATLAANGAETDADGILPVVMSNQDCYAFRSNGTGWVTKEVGTRASSNKRLTGGVLQPYHEGRVGLYDTSGGNLSVTLPASPNTNDFYTIDLWADGGGFVTVTPNSGQTLTYGGSNPASIVISSIKQGKKFTWNGSTWVVTEPQDGHQGIFSNNYVFSGNVEVAGNILFVNQTWGFRIEGDGTNLPPETFLHHNTILPYLPTDINSDGVIGANDGAIVFGTEGAIETRGYNIQIADANIANNFPVINGGGKLSHNVDLDYGIVDIGTTTKYDAYLNGAGSYLPTTKAEAIAAVTLTSGDYVGAVAYWDFDNGVAKTPPAMTVESNDATISTGVAFTISMSQVIAKSTGNIELYNVTDTVTVETIAASSGSVAVDGCDLNVTFAGSISAGKTYSVRIAADAITSRYSGAWSAITDDSISATGA